MRKIGFRSIVILIVLLVGLGCSSTQKGSLVKTDAKSGLIRPPKAEKIAKELTIHGHTRIDNYYWMNQRENPKVVSYLTAENNYVKATMKHTVKLQEKLYQEIIGRVKQEDTSVPYVINGYDYYTRYEKAKEYPIHCRKKETPQEPKRSYLMLMRWPRVIIFSGCRRILR